MENNLENKLKVLCKAIKINGHLYKQGVLKIDGYSQVENHINGWLRKLKLPYITKYLELDCADCVYLELTYSENGGESQRIKLKPYISMIIEEISINIEI